MNRRGSPPIARQCRLAVSCRHDSRQLRFFLHARAHPVRNRPWPPINRAAHFSSATPHHQSSSSPQLLHAPEHN
uniref:Uncharacterized protein n=1 Tax=Arundo donax TaxID=35708 RepID=A0A0A9H3B5_ARUDO